MTIKAAIFDLDGTLLDTLADIAEAVNRVLEAWGHPTHGPDAYRYFVGDGSEMLVTRALPEDQRSDEAVQQALKAFKAHYRKNWDRRTRPFDGVPQLLDALVRQGIRLAVCSNKPHEFSVLCVEKLLQPWRFDQIVGQSPRFAKKPAPDMALAIAERVGIRPGETLFVGDSGVDMRTAVAAGMVPVGAAWGFRTEAELMENGCRFVVRHPLEVLKLIGHTDG